MAGIPLGTHLTVNIDSGSALSSGGIFEAITRICYQGDGFDLACDDRFTAQDSRRIEVGS